MGIYIKKISKNEKKTFKNLRIPIIAKVVPLYSHLFFNKSSVDPSVEDPYKIRKAYSRKHYVYAPLVHLRHLQLPQSREGLQ